MTVTIPPLRDAALAYAAHGLHVLACLPREKLPLTDHGLHDASTDPAIIERTWNENPNANIGLACAASGLVVLDIDNRSGGAETLAGLIGELGPLPETAETATGSVEGGRHLFFKAPPGAAFRGSLGKGIEVKHHGYVILPDSIHPSGKPYVAKRSLLDTEPVELPPAWLARMLKRAAPAVASRPCPTATPTQCSPYGRKAIAVELERVRTAPEGKRNATANKAAFSLAQLHAGKEIPDVCGELVQAALAAGLPESEAQKTVESGWCAGLAKPREAPKRTAPPIREATAANADPPRSDGEERRPPRAFALTETGGAELFADRLHGEIAFVPDWGRWLVWTGTHWKEDTAEVSIMERTKLVAREFLAESRWAMDCNDPRAPSFTQFAAAAQRRNFRQAVLALSKCEPGIAVPFTTFDANPYLLNVANGTVDLRTGELRPHSREDKITRALPWAYDPTASCPRWQRFLREILPDEETVTFVRRAVGYSLSADVSEHVLFFLHGLGANGKSVFLLVLLELLGDYATQAPSSMLLAKQGETHPTELTVLHGRRIAVCQETPAGRGWAEEVLKHVTGGDRISARRMREDFWEFPPTHKLWVSSNHRPPVRGTDEGIWRRLRLVPFEKVIPENERDPKLAEKLRAEVAGILAWAVEGFRLWQRDGLGQSSKVRAATADYRDESDRLGPFVAECCVLDSRATVTRAALYRAYVAWAEVQHARPMGDREFVEAVRGRGLVECNPRVNGKQARSWRGIGLLDCTDSRYPNDSPIDGLCEAPRETNRRIAGEVQSVPSPPAAAPDPVAQLGNCLRVRSDTTASETEKLDLVSFCASLPPEKVQPALDGLWAWWKAEPAPTVARWLARQQGTRPQAAGTATEADALPPVLRREADTGTVTDYSFSTHSPPNTEKAPR